MPTHGDFQWMVLARIVKLLQNDVYLQSFVGKRIYAQNIATMDQPEFPCITVTRQGLGSDPGIREVDSAYLMVDVWSKKDIVELWRIYASKDSITGTPRGVRALLHQGANGQPVGFDFPEAVVDACREMHVVDDLFESFSRTFHLAARYDLRYAAKRV